MSNEDDEIIARIKKTASKINALEECLVTLSSVKKLKSIDEKMLHYVDGAGNAIKVCPGLNAFYVVSVALCSDSILGKMKDLLEQSRANCFKEAHDLTLNLAGIPTPKLEATSEPKRLPGGNPVPTWAK